MRTMKVFSAIFFFRPVTERSLAHVVLLGMTILFGCSLYRRILALAQGKQRRIPPLIIKLNCTGLVARLCGLQPLRVVAIRKLRFVMSPARFVAGERAHGDGSRKNEHVPELAGKVQRLIGP